MIEIPHKKYRDKVYSRVQIAKELLADTPTLRRRLSSTGYAKGRVNDIMIHLDMLFNTDLPCLFRVLHDLAKERKVANATEPSQPSEVC